MSIEAGLCKYAELNDKIKQELRTKKKVTITAVSAISAAPWTQAKPFRCTALRAMIWLAT